MYIIFFIFSLFLCERRIPHIVQDLFLVLCLRVIFGRFQDHMNYHSICIERELTTCKASILSTIILAHYYFVFYTCTTIFIGIFTYIYHFSKWLIICVLFYLFKLITNIVFYLPFLLIIFIKFYHKVWVNLSLVLRRWSFICIYFNVLNHYFFNEHLGNCKFFDIQSILLYITYQNFSLATSAVVSLGHIYKNGVIVVMYVQLYVLLSKFVKAHLLAA